MIDWFVCDVVGKRDWFCYFLIKREKRERQASIPGFGFKLQTDFRPLFLSLNIYLEAFGRYCTVGNTVGQNFVHTVQ